mgnify:CR=1 FL=1
MRAGFRLVIFVLALCLLPLTALAQGSITGVVRDPSGAVLPGVTVEASSPALIQNTFAFDSRELQRKGSTGLEIWF